MKRHYRIQFAFLMISILFLMTACEKTKTVHLNEVTTGAVSTMGKGIEEQLTEPDAKNKEKTHLQIITDAGNITVELYDNSATKDLVKRLPMRLSFEDYNEGTEKISYLDEELDTTDVPDKWKPQGGDLTYYVPWGNLAFFNREFHESSDLVPLGKIIKGRRHLKDIDKSKEITIKKYNN